MAASTNNPLPKGKQTDSILHVPPMTDEIQLRDQLAGVIALLLSIIAPGLIALAYLLQNDTGFFWGFHAVLYGPIPSGVATLLGLLALPGRYARRALCICGIWWTWWIYAVTQWSWNI